MKIYQNKISIYLELRNEEGLKIRYNRLRIFAGIKQCNLRAFNRLTFLFSINFIWIPYIRAWIIEKTKYKRLPMTRRKNFIEFSNYSYF